MTARAARILLALAMSSSASAEPASALEPLLLHDGHDDDSVRPILECVAQPSAGQYVAYFGYKNEDSHPVTIPIGSRNRFSPGAQDRGQPTRFEPGRSPYYPNAAFSVPFSGSLTWTLKGPDGDTETATASANSNRCVLPPPPPAACALPAFPAERFNRTCGPPETYSRSFPLPAGAGPPFVLTITNGESNGSHRVSSATVRVNGATVAAPSDFNPNVGQIERNVVLNPQNTLTVQLQSAPDSYLTLSICASSADTTAPSISFAAPPALSNDATPAVTVRYSDAGTGVNLSALRVLVDGEDRTALFSKRSDEASAELAPALADGLHRLRAEIRDVAGNAAAAETSFTVDTGPPALVFVAPLAGSYVSQTATTVRLRYDDASGLDLSALKLTLNGADVSARLTRLPGEASGVVNLPAGPSLLLARIRDRAGNESSASAAVVIDLQPPVLSIVQPGSGGRFGSPTPELQIRYSDDQALDPASLRVTVDGTAIGGVVAGPDMAMAALGPLSDGSHIVAATVADRAGHVASASAGFSVDTNLPDLQVLYPLPGQLTAEIAPVFYATYSDSQGIELAALRIRVNGVDQTGLFGAGPSSVSGELAGLVEGSNTVECEIADSTGNRATARVTFVRDTVAPQVSITEPAGGFVVTARPRLLVSYGDSGSGVERGRTGLFVDGVDRSSLLVEGAGGAEALLDADLPEGAHEIRFVVQDYAGNRGEATATFVVDTAPPVLVFQQPFAGQFINDDTPLVRVGYADAGAGVVPGSFELAWLASDGSELAVQSVTPAADGAAGELLLPLGQGTQHLRARIRDRAGNVGIVEVPFELDSIQPTAIVQVPGAGDYAGTSTPPIVIAYADERSGLDLGLLRITIDGEERAGWFALVAESATLVWPEGERLGDGPHEIVVTAVDRAGNELRTPAHRFFIDTVPPEVRITAPSLASWLGTPSTEVTGTASDSSAAGVFAVHAFLDGVEANADLVLEGGLVRGHVLLGDGPHELRLTAEDWAGNVGESSTTFVADLAPPQLGLTAPEPWAVVGTSPVELHGTATDADPEVVVGAAAEAGAVPCSPGFACVLPLVEGLNHVIVTATDRLGHTATLLRAVTLDTQPPQLTIVSPPPGFYANQPTLSVSGNVTDAADTTVTVNGVAATVGDGAFSATIPTGAGPVFAVEVVAVDRASNSTQARVEVHFDAAPPQVAITAPLPGAALRGPSISVSGTVSDDSVAMVEVNGRPAERNGDQFSAEIPVADGPLELVAIARDGAANVSTARIDVIVDSAAPQLAITSPAPGTSTRASTLAIEGTVSDATAVALRLDGEPLPVLGGAFRTTLDLPSEGERTPVVSATDAAGNTVTTSVTVRVDRSPPVLEVLAPVEGAHLAGGSVVVMGTLSDASEVSVTVNGMAATLTGAAWQATVSLPVGPQALTIVATDAAGNMRSLERTVVIEGGGPALTIVSPLGSALTREDSYTIAGILTGAEGVSLTLDGAAVPVSGGAFQVVVALAEGDNRFHLAAGTAEAEIDIVRDTTPPILELSAPDGLARGSSDDVSATATDAHGVADVALEVDGVSLAECTLPLCSALLVAPEEGPVGAMLRLTARAHDLAGNVATTTREVPVVADGMVTGLVIDDATSLPLAGAEVVLVTARGSASTVSDERGRYAVKARSATALLTATRIGMTKVERVVSVEPGVGTVPVDLRIRALAPPAGDGTQTTPLSPQGLPALLPLGWSPRGAVHITVGAEAAFTGLPPEPLALAKYDEALHAWTLVAMDLVPESGRVTTPVPGPGSYALVSADPGGPALPPVGAVLPASGLVLLPASTTMAGDVAPAVVPPTGGVAQASLSLAAPLPPPSGTVVQAEIAETYTLASGETASTETRRQDILVYRTPDAALAASFPVAASRTYDPAEIRSGAVHLDILAGREGVRGKVGGNSALVVEDGAVRIAVPGAALPEDTVVTLKASALDGDPAPGVVVVAAWDLDLAGRTLDLAGELSIEAPDGGGATMVFARLERLLGVPRLVVVAVAERVGERWVSRSTPGLVGIVSEGHYDLLRLDHPIGLVSGHVLAAGHPVRAFVESDALPFVGVADSAGAYHVTVKPGTVELRGYIPGTSLSGRASLAVAPDENAVQDLSLEGSTSTATVTPGDGSTGISTSVVLQIEASVTLSPGSADAGLRLSAESGADVPTRASLSADRRVLSLVPESPLAEGRIYSLAGASLVDAFGGLVAVPTTRFTTRSTSGAGYDLSRLVFSMPDAEGLVSLTAPAGTLPAGARVLVVNTSNAFVAGFETESDGAVGAVFPATLKASISDTLVVTITDPLGRSTTFTRSQFEDTASGIVAVGPGGGVVRASDGSDAELRIPEGGLRNGARFKVSALASLEDLPEERRALPEFPDGEFAGALRIESDDAPRFEREAKLAFPMPQNLSFDPAEASFHVYRRIDGPNGPLFETIDHADIERVGGKVRVVTASWPLPGYVSSFGGMSDIFEGLATAVNNLYLIAARSIVGVSPAGAITGKVRRERWGSGAAGPVFDAVENASVSVGIVEDGQCRPLADSPNPPVAVSQRDGTYTLVDPRYDGGPVTIAAVVSGEARCVEAFEVVHADADGLPAAQRLLDRYRRVASADVSFSAAAPPEPPAAIDIDLFVRDGDALRPVTTAATLGSELVLRLTASGAGNLTATLQGEPCVAREERPGLATIELGEDPHCHVATAGLYSVVARGVTVFGGTTVSASRSFLVVAPGQGNDQPIPDAAPAVLAAVPRDRSRNVAPTTLPQLTFSEPVRINGGVTLQRGGEDVPCRSIGVGTDGQAFDLSTAPGRPITAVTLQPLVALDYGASYSIAWSEAVRDLDEPPKELAPGTAGFETVSPQLMSATDEKFGSPGVAVVDGRAYLTESFATGTGARIRVFDVSDPSAPIPITQNPVGDVVGTPADIVADGTTLVVATGPKATPQPSNVYIFDVREPQATRWIGAASASVSSMLGTVTRLAIRGGQIYAAVSRQGVKVAAVSEVVKRYGDPKPGFPMSRDLATDGVGYASDVFSEAVPVLMENGKAAYLTDIEVDDFLIDEAPETLVAVTGDVPLALVSPQAQFVYSVGPIATNGAELTNGAALAVGRLGSRHVAVVAGYGRASGASASLLAIVDVTDPTAPATLAILDLSAQIGNLTITDVLLKDGVAFVGLQEADVAHAEGKLLVVNLGDGAHPSFNYAVKGVGGRLAMGEGNVLVSTARAYSGTSGPLGGLRQLALGSTIGLLDADKRGLARIRLPQNFTTYITANVPSASDSIEVEASIVDYKNGSVRPPGRLPTSRPIQLNWDPESGRFVGRLQVVDRDCALELDHNPDTDEQFIKTPCEGDLESGPWTKLRLQLASQDGGLERVVDIHAFRLVTLGDSLTQGVQHSTVVHEDQRYSYPAQLAGQINEFLKGKYGQQVVFRQAMIADPGVSKPQLRNPHLDGHVDDAGFPRPGRLNPGALAVNNLGLSGARVAHLHTAKEGDWPRYRDESPWVCRKDADKCRKYKSPVDNPAEPKAVWRFVLVPEGQSIENSETAVEEACSLDPSLLFVLIGNNDALNAATASEMQELTTVADFQDDYNALMDSLGTCLQGRADLVVGTIPDVRSIPHLREVGEAIGAVPFTLPGLPKDLPIPPLLPVTRLPIADPFTRQFEKMHIEATDTFGQCIGNDLNGACLGGDLGGAKVGIGILGRTLAVEDLVSAANTLNLFARQTEVMRRVVGFETIRLDPGQALSPDDLRAIQLRIEAFNRHITGPRWAEGHSWPVMDMNRLFQTRTTEAAQSDPTHLNALFTGTPRDVRREGDEFRRGIGNTMLSWDGVHPNSAGYSLAANEAIRALQVKLEVSQYGGLDKGSRIGPVPPAITTKLLTDTYLTLEWSRIYGWQELLPKVIE